VPTAADLLGFVTWAIFLRFILRGTAPLLYAVSFALTSVLELYGTGSASGRGSRCSRCSCSRRQPAERRRRRVRGDDALTDGS